jgi:hypothetical protein
MAKDEIVDAEGEGAPATDNFVTGIVVFTTVALLFGFILIEMALKNHYGRGLMGGG